uniref:peptide-methionine (S)-S-oxide reductase n=1 Tax=Prasinoderma coloniale TaxID=156133 RepID=A0A7R9U0I6_9VIRI|mmetsp:Transcript_9607/g.39500  ORF Transcript_9607/g.39500 Transcript_9607/m.39500 type:complete len:119 (+) Transcript_9607:233-589(+)
MAESPTYKTVCAGDGHTEAMKVTFDPSVVSYAELFDRFIGEANIYGQRATKPQYMNAVWTTNPEQTAHVNARLREVAESTDRKVTLKVARAMPWYDAEEYHQHYIAKSRSKAGYFGGL